MLHAVLVLRRLEREAGPARALGPGPVRSFLPRHGRQSARNGGRRPRGAAQNAPDRRGVLRPPGGLPGRARRARTMSALAATLQRNVFAGARGTGAARPACGLCAARRSASWPRRTDGSSAARACLSRSRQALLPQSARDRRNRQERRGPGACPNPNRLGACRSDVGEVPETGRHVDLVADEPARAAIAELAGLARAAAPCRRLRRHAAWPRRPARGRPCVGDRRSDLRRDARTDRERGRRSDRPRLRARRDVVAGDTDGGAELEIAAETRRNRWSTASSISARLRPSS